MPIEFLLPPAILLLGGFVQGLTGFGLALVSVPLLALILGVKTAVPLAGVFGWLVTLPLVWKMRRHVPWTITAVLFAGSLPGSWLGAELLRRLPGEIILATMGVVLLVSSIHALRSRGPVVARAPKWLGAVVGFLSGALGAAVGEPGPPVIAYTSLMPWTADQAKATLASFFMLQMIGALVSFYHKDLITPEVTSLILRCFPTFAIGAAAGMFAYGRLQRLNVDYHKVVHSALVVIGCALIWKAA